MNILADIPAIAGIDDPAKARVLLYQAGRPVHAPLDQVGLLTDTEAADTYLTTASAATTYLAIGEVTDWIAYTPTFTGFGTVTAASVWSRRVGDTLHLRGKFTAGTPTATEARMTLGYNGTNANVSSHATKITSLQYAGKMAGDAAGAVEYFMLIESNVGYVTFGRHDASNAGLVKRNGDIMFSPGRVVSFLAQLPIAGW